MKALTMDIISGTDNASRLSNGDRNPWSRVGAECLAWFRTLASASVWATVIVTFGFQVARVEGRSMEPTLHDHDRLVVGKLPYAIHAPEVGDVVMVRRPDNPDQLLVKRVVATPGDTVEFRGGELVRNGVPATEDFIAPEFRSYEDRSPEIVPLAYYYVLGDHRNDSADSRVFGPVPEKYILGKVEVRWWPLTGVRTY